jgi:hypothetical protein
MHCANSLNEGVYKIKERRFMSKRNFLCRALGYFIFPYFLGSRKNNEFFRFLPIFLTYLGFDLFSPNNNPLKRLIKTFRRKLLKKLGGEKNG